MSDFESILYETPGEHVARIVLNRPDTRNAQDTRLLYELNSAFDRAPKTTRSKSLSWQLTAHIFPPDMICVRSTPLRRCRNSRLWGVVRLYLRGGGKADGA